MTIPFDKLLLTTRKLWKESPPRLSLIDRLNYYHIWTPPWFYLYPFNGIHKLLGRQKQVYQNGVIVWGQIVMPNEVLYQNGPLNAPAVVVYSFSSPQIATPDALVEVAGNVFDLKTDKLPASRTRQLKELADFLKRETDWGHGIPVPNQLGMGLNCQLSTILVVRNHLPLPRLRHGFFPLLVNPEKPHYAIILPERHWPKPLVRLWTTS